MSSVAHGSEVDKVSIGNDDVSSVRIVLVEGSGIDSEVLLSGRGSKLVVLNGISVVVGSTMSALVVEGVGSSVVVGISVDSVVEREILVDSSVVVIGTSVDSVVEKSLSVDSVVDIGTSVDFEVGK